MRYIATVHKVLTFFLTAVNKCIKLTLKNTKKETLRKLCSVRQMVSPENERMLYEKRINLASHATVLATKEALRDEPSSAETGYHGIRQKLTLIRNML